MELFTTKTNTRTMITTKYSFHLVKYDPTTHQKLNDQISYIFQALKKRLIELRNSYIQSYEFCPLEIFAIIIAYDDCFLENLIDKVFVFKQFITSDSKESRENIEKSKEKQYVVMTALPLSPFLQTYYYHCIIFKFHSFTLITPPIQAHKLYNICSYNYGNVINGYFCYYIQLFSGNECVDQNELWLNKILKFITNSSARRKLWHLRPNSPNTEKLLSKNFPEYDYHLSTTPEYEFKHTRKFTTCGYNCLDCYYQYKNSGGFRSEWIPSGYHDAILQRHHEELVSPYYTPYPDPPNSSAFPSPKLKRETNGLKHTYKFQFHLNFHYNSSIPNEYIVFIDNVYRVS
jgi:hypothetical protein